MQQFCQQGGENFDAQYLETEFRWNLINLNSQHFVSWMHIHRRCPRSFPGAFDRAVPQGSRVQRSYVHHNWWDTYLTLWNNKPKHPLIWSYYYSRSNTVRPLLCKKDCQTCLCLWRTFKVTNWHSLCTFETSYCCIGLGNVPGSSMGFLFRNICSLSDGADWLNMCPIICTLVRPWFHKIPAELMQSLR